MRPHVSLIIPVHNAEPFLDRCLASAAAQTGLELEIICVDDASTDRSPAMLDARAAADSRFRVVHRPVNGGESAARNHGVALARGDYLAFLDHDDMLEPDACRKLYQAAKAADADIVRGRVKTVDYEGHASLSPLQLHRDICDISRFYFTGDWWSAIYRASLVQGKVSFAEEFILGADTIFLTETLIAASKVTCIDDLVYTHFSRPDSGDSRTLPPDRLRSTIAARLRIAELLHRANIDGKEKKGYLHKMWQSFEGGLDLLSHRCTDSESRALCCDFLYSIKNMHRYPQEFFATLEDAHEFFFPLFIKDGQRFLRNIVMAHENLSSPLFINTLRKAGLRCAAAEALARRSSAQPG